MYGLLLGLFGLLGVVFGWLAFFHARRLQNEVDGLRRRLGRLEQERIDGPAPASTRPPDSSTQGTFTVDRDWNSRTASSASGEADAIDGTPALHSTTPHLPVDTSSPLAPARPVSAAGDTPVSGSVFPAPSAEHTSASDSTPAPPVGPPVSTPAQPSRWLAGLREHWMSWLGGTCIGLAGIFLVRYSIEQGLLGPAARIALGLAGGLALHAGAFWLRRRSGPHESIAALAAGGSITLFAAILAGLHLYDFFSPGLAFALLAPVALLTMGLALWHGPLLAALGLLGAYALPLLVGGDSDQVVLVLAYVLLITAAGLLLLRHVDRSWLWAGLHLGTGLWWLLTLWTYSADGARGWYLAAWVWLLFALPDGDWWLRMRVPLEGMGWRRFWHWPAGRERQQVLGLALALAAWTCSILTGSFDNFAFVQWTPFAALVLWLAGRRPRLLGLAWLIAPLCWTAWALQGLLAGPPAPALLPAFYWYCLGSAVVLVALAWYNARDGHAAAWKPFALLPLGFLVLAWWLSPGVSDSLQWPLFACLFAGCYLALATVTLRRATEEPLVAACFFIGCHLGYALAVAFYLDEASLTLALALQLISLAWLQQRFGLPVLGWVFKGVVALVLVRLSLNPWLVQYPDDVHWSLWTYGGATLCCWLASRQLTGNPILKAWSEGATLHLFTLFVWTELRWWLHDGVVFAPRWTALEAGLDCAVFGALALVYHWRERFTTHLARLYRVYSLVLLVLSLWCYLFLLRAMLVSDPWLTGTIGNTWFFNRILLLFGMPVLLAAAVARLHIPALRRPAQWIAIGGAFVFICLQVRHFWQGSIALDRPTGPAELYTYSAVWLLLAVGTLLAGAWRLGRDCYRGGMALLLVVVAKLFLVDMSDLDGLLRVASFLGMGLALLGIAWLHRRLQKGSDPNF